MKKSEHPPTCEECHGTGWQPGPEIHSIAHGQPVHYSTVEPCTRHWSDDEPAPPTDLLTFAEYREQASPDQLVVFDKNKDRWTIT